MTFILNQLVLAAWNVINSRIDAYRILKQKYIAHGVNFAAYAVATGLVVWVAGYDWKTIILFCISAFANRQLSFDIPLNLRRGLPWYYQSAANPPKALMDKIERKLFGMDYDGKKIVMYYSILFIWSIIPNLFYK
jgi:hypothetical protein